MIRFRSSLAIGILAAAIVLGLIVGATGAIIATRANSNAASTNQKSEAIATQIAATNKDIDAAKADLKSKEAARDRVNRRYNQVGGRVDKLLETVSGLKQENESLQSEYDTMPEAPNLIGQYYTAAETIIEQAGLSWSLQDKEGASCSEYVSPNYDTIFEQHPSPGTKMKAGSWVTIYRLKYYGSTSWYQYNLCSSYTY